MDRTWTLAAAGDAIIGRRTAHLTDTEPRFAAIGEIVRSADVASVNLETNVFDLDGFEGWPGSSALDHLPHRGERPGGVYLLADPLALQDLASMGFDVYARANNHTGDWGIEGLLATSRELDALGLAHAGVGRDMQEASRPAYVDRAIGRVAMISLTTTFAVSSKAAAQRPDSKGRPGCNGVTIHRALRASRAVHDELQAAAQAMGNPHLFARMGIGVELADDNTTRVVEWTDHTDMERLEDEIARARRFADAVIINAHVHEPTNHVTQPPLWLQSLARACIDAGADAYLGHGPPRLRPIEIYANRPIFYSMGTFMAHNQTRHLLPADLLTIRGLDPQTPANEYYATVDSAKKAAGGDAAHGATTTSILPIMTFDEQGISGIEVHVVELASAGSRAGKGTPMMASINNAERTLEHLTELSAPYGAGLSVSDGRGTWRRDDEASG